MFGATGGLGMEVAQGLVTAKDFDAKKAVVSVGIHPAKRHKP